MLAEIGMEFHSTHAQYLTVYTVSFLLDKPVCICENSNNELKIGG